MDINLKNSFSDNRFISPNRHTLAEVNHVINYLMGRPISLCILDSE